MKWSELSGKDKIKLILEHVYGYYFVDDERYVSRHRGKLPKDFHWPIAWWDETLEYWSTRDISSNWNTAFDPLHDMNDTWQILEATHADGKFDGFSLTGIYMPNNEMTYICRLNIYGKITEAAADTPQDAICVAVLRVHGVEVDLAKG